MTRARTLHARARHARCPLVARVVIALAIALFGLFGCMAPRTAPAIDEVLMAYLSTARTLHHEADIAEDRGDVKAAVAPLDRLVHRTPPRQAPEVEEVLADTYARLGDLRSRLGEFDAALADVERGLSHAPGISYFRGHLVEVRGLVEERRGKALATAGDATGAERARTAAMKSYEEAIGIQDEVIRRGTSAGGKP